MPCAFFFLNSLKAYCQIIMYKSNAQKTPNHLGRSYDMVIKQAYHEYCHGVIRSNVSHVYIDSANASMKKKILRKSASVMTSME